MHGEGDTAHNNIIHCKTLKVRLGGVYRATCADEGGTQGALFMCYTVYYSKLQWQRQALQANN